MTNNKNTKIHPCCKEIEVFSKRICDVNGYCPSWRIRSIFVPSTIKNYHKFNKLEKDLDILKLKKYELENKIKKACNQMKLICHTHGLDEQEFFELGYE